MRVVDSPGLEGGGYVVGMEFERVERPAGGELSGDLLDAAEVMAGAEAGHVKMWSGGCGR